MERNFSQNITWVDQTFLFIQGLWKNIENCNDILIQLNEVANQKYQEEK